MTDGGASDPLELSAIDRDRLLHLVERRLPHLLDEPDRIEWYVAEVLSYWQARGTPRRGRRDWPLTILNRMLRVEMTRHQGRLPRPAEVRHAQAERRLAAAVVEEAERTQERLRRSLSRAAPAGRVEPREAN